MHCILFVAPLELGSLKAIGLVSTKEEEEEPITLLAGVNSSEANNLLNMNK